MALTISQLSGIAKEIISSQTKIKDAKQANADIDKEREELQKKQANFKVFYDKFNGMVVAYQTERRWLDGVTAATLPFSQIDEGAQRLEDTPFFPTSWGKLTPKITANVNGNPTSESANDEDEELNSDVAGNGLIALIDLLRNGQSSGVGNHTLSVAYSPGAPTITLTTGTQTVGNLLYISGSGTSALVEVTAAVGTLITIDEIIPPDGTIATVGSSVVENIVGFTNTERNTLVSATYQNILTNLTTKISNTVTTWNTSLTNQLTQLNKNKDTASGIATAKTNVQAAQTAISTWQALSSTGASGKYVNTSLDNLETAYDARNSQRSGRLSEIVKALGTAKQSSGTGNISGTGLYTQRFKSINLMINSTDGPLYQYYSKAKIKEVNDQTTQNELGKQEIFNTGVKVIAFKSNGNGSNVVTVKSATGLAMSDKVLVVADGLPDIEATITAIVGNNITISKPVPNSYVLDLKASLAKAT